MNSESASIDVCGVPAGEGDSTEHEEGDVDVVEDADELSGFWAAVEGDADAEDDTSGSDRSLSPSISPAANPRGPVLARDASASSRRPAVAVAADGEAG